MFPQLAKQPAHLFTDHSLNNQRLVVLRYIVKTEKGKLKVGQFLFIFLFFILFIFSLVIHKCIDNNNAAFQTAYYSIRTHYCQYRQSEQQFTTQL